MSDPKYVKFRYKKGLWNNLFKMFTACRIAEVEGRQLIEPIFKWNRRPAVNFSDIYDLDHFNSRMRVRGRPMIVREAEVDPQLIDDRSMTYDLWRGSPNIYDLNKQRELNCIPRGCSSTRVLMALRIHPQNRQTVEDRIPMNAIHVRWESEWVGHAQKRQPGLPAGERMLVPPTEIASMYSKQFKAPVFFTTGAGHAQVTQDFAGQGVETAHFFDGTLPYEVNAAINFEICTRAPVFVGNSRSTFANLITLKRHLTGAGSSFIYNCNDHLLPRVDAGLHFVGQDTVTKHVLVADKP